MVVGVTTLLETPENPGNPEIKATQIQFGRVVAHQFVHDRQMQFQYGGLIRVARDVDRLAHPFDHRVGRGQLIQMPGLDGLQAVGAVIVVILPFFVAVGEFPRVEAIAARPREVDQRVVCLVPLESPPYLERTEIGVTAVLDIGTDLYRFEFIEGLAYRTLDFGQKEWAFV